MPFHFFVGVLSVVRFLRLCLLLFHGDQTPGGVYWDALLQLVPSILHLPRPRPREIFGHEINVLEHSADVTRLWVLLEYGGVYVDTDQYLLRSVTDLLTHSATIGIELPGENCSNGIIFAEPEAPFLKLCLSRYSTFNDSVWAVHSTVVPYNLSLEYPHLIHVVDSFFRPNYMHLMPLYQERRGGGRGGRGGRGQQQQRQQFSWEGLYGLHLYDRFFHGYFDTGGVTTNTMDRRCSVIGDMTRHLLYGSADRCSEYVSPGKKK